MDYIGCINATHGLLAGRVSLREWSQTLVEHIKITHQQAALKASEGVMLSPAISQEVRTYTQNALNELRHLAVSFQQSPPKTPDAQQEFCEAVGNCLNLERCASENVRVLVARENGAQLVERILPGGGCTPECHAEAAMGRVPIGQFTPLSKGACNCVFVTSYRVAMPSPVAAIANRDKNICSDCGKRMGTLEKFANAMEGDNRCFDCDKKFKEEQERLKRDEESRQNALVLATEQKQLARRQADLQSILDGNLPIVQAAIVLKKGEVCHHVVDAGILENRVVDRVRVGQSASVSFRVCKGVRYSTGGSRGRMIAITGIVRVDEGQLCVTNQRCVFVGKTKSIAIPHGKLVSFEPYADGLMLNPENKKSIMLQLDDGEMASVVLSAILNAD